MAAARIQDKPKMEDCKIETVPFLERLPLEIRNVIYRNLLSTKYTKRPCLARKMSFHAKLWPGHAYHFDPAILRTNRRVHSEAYAILYHENMFVRVRITDGSLGHLMNLKCIPTFLKGHRAETFKHCAMSVNLDRQNTGGEMDGPGDKPCYVIASDDIGLLCQSFLIHDIFMSDTYGHSMFRVTVHRLFDDTLSYNLSPSSPQYRLLEPFTILHSISHFKIAGSANPEYCASIAVRVSRMAPPVEDCFNQVIELRDEGRESVGRNDLKGAVKVYKMAISQLIYSYIPRTIQKHDWARLHPQQCQTAIDTCFTLLADLAFLHYRIEEFEDAHFWAQNARTYGLSSGTLQHEMLYAKLVYLQAMASTRLGDHQQAADELRSGLRLVGKAVYEDDELVQWRMQARTQIWGGGGRGTVTLFEAMGIPCSDSDEDA